MPARERLHYEVGPVGSITFRRRSASAGFTLLELACAVVVVMLLATAAVPTWRSIIEKQKVQQCANDLLHIASAIERFRTTNRFRPPDSLADLSNIPVRDPWDHPYQYLNFSSGAPNVKGKIRKDRNLHPLNSEFDLYSMGPDGQSMPPLTAKASRDDVIWARDGSFVGVAEDF
jgi:general secretion pathway protein G